MSFSVLVIPEDPEQNGYILRPLVRAIMQDVDRPAAKVKLLTSPRVQGYDQAMKSLRGEDLEVYGFMDLWLFLPGRRQGQRRRDARRGDSRRGERDHVVVLRSTTRGGDLRQRCVPRRNTGNMGRGTPSSTDEGGSVCPSARETRRRSTAQQGQRSNDQPIVEKPPTTVPSLSRAAASARSNREPPIEEG